jgi:DNA-binding transcriptional MocR family regulator
VLPSFHNPCSVTLAPDRARQLVELSDHYDFVILADEPYVMLHFAAPPPSMMSYDDGRGRVLGLGSFSKILGPGLRLGWVHAHERWIERFVDHGVLRSGGGLNPVVSSIVHGAIGSGFLPTHIERLRRALRRRAVALTEALDAHLPDVSYAHPEGGYFVWCRFPGDIDTAARLEHARNHHAVGYCPGSRCAVDRDLAEYLRLSFSFYEEAELTEAIRRLAAAMR